MRYYQTYTVRTPNDGGAEIPASVPGNVQLDYITAHPEFCGDINYGMEHKKMVALEPYSWVYRTVLRYTKSPDERVFFVTEGIDYIWDVVLDGKTIYSHEGMFSRVELDITDMAKPGSVLEVVIHPHPMLHDGVKDRTQAAQCVKPPVSYEWDWHPRVIPSGIWDDTYIETRKADFINHAEARYTLSEDFTRADLHFDIDCAGEFRITLFDPKGRLIYFGSETDLVIENPMLWWCRGQGEASLYTYVVTSSSDFKKGHIGFRRVKLVMNEGAWNEPSEFPKSRSVPPCQLELNGRRIFAKGSNYVNHEIFTGTLNRAKYEEQIQLAVACNMNIYRCWGGSGVQKTAFYDLCDFYGMMLWVEFPLACNNYYDSPHYLAVLEQEASAIIRKIRSHPSLVLWCGGNELFNNWSLMTDQHLALRLLDKLTYELCRDVPYIMTSPLSGMKHGGYTFIDGQTGLDQFALFTRSKATAYTEFGMPGITSVEMLREIIPEEELFPIPAERGGSWKAHHAFEAWGKEAWMGYPTLEKYGDVSTLEALVETSQWLQYVGYKAIFEEARRQKPYCAMAINWCWCEPWKCAVNNSLIAYPNIKKVGWYSVRDSLRDVVGTARMFRFDYKRGERFECELWLLNDLPEEVKDAVVTVYAVIPCGEGKNVTCCFGISRFHDVAPLTNAKGGTFGFDMPEDAYGNRFEVIVETKLGDEVLVNRYPMAIAKEEAKADLSGDVGAFGTFEKK